MCSRCTRVPFRVASAAVSEACSEVCETQFTQQIAWNFLRRFLYNFLLLCGLRSHAIQVWTLRLITDFHYEFVSPWWVNSLYKQRTILLYELRCICLQLATHCPYASYIFHTCPSNYKVHTVVDRILDLDPNVFYNPLQQICTQFYHHF